MRIIICTLWAGLRMSEVNVCKGLCGYLSDSVLRTWFYWVPFSPSLRNWIFSLSVNLQECFHKHIKQLPLARQPIRNWRVGWYSSCPHLYYKLVREKSRYYITVWQCSNGDNFPKVGGLLEPVGCPSSFLIGQLEERRGTPGNERRNGSWRQEQGRCVLCSREQYVQRSRVKRVHGVSGMGVRYPEM